MLKFFKWVSWYETQIGISYSPNYGAHEFVIDKLHYFMEFLMWSFNLHPSDDMKILTISSYLIYDIGHAKLAGDIAIGPLMEEKVEVEDIVAESILDIVHEKYAHYKKTELEPFAGYYGVIGYHIKINGIVLNFTDFQLYLFQVGDEEGTKEIAPGKMKVQFSCRCILE
ncbi:hypothetical protein C5167_011747 [Papaver somniferum]|nr:hypothetical protein C5167_011747 [Papaver somniferum]